MTVYTVIGHITNAILTIEPLQIPSNLSVGPLLWTRPQIKELCPPGRPSEPQWTLTSSQTLRNF